MHYTSWKFFSSWKFSLHVVYKYFDRVSVRNLHWVYLLKNGHNMTPWMWSCDFSWNFLQRFNFLVEMLTFKQGIKVTSGRNRFGKRTVQNLQTRMHFSKKLCDQVDKIIARLHYQKVSPMLISKSYHVKKLVINT